MMGSGGARLTTTTSRLLGAAAWPPLLSAPGLVAAALWQSPTRSQVVESSLRLFWRAGEGLEARPSDGLAPGLWTA